jgi:hypothetical protein
MAQEMIDYAAILADAKAKRAALDAFIASLENAQALGALGQPGEGVSAPLGFGISGPPVELPVGALKNKSVSNAIKLYLAACKKKQSIHEIATALKEGGIESTSKNFEVIVYNALRALTKAGIVLQFKDGWALAELYNPQLRARLAQQNNAPKKSAKKGRRKAKRSGATNRQATIQELPKAV